MCLTSEMDPQQVAEHVAALRAEMEEMRTRMAQMDAIKKMQAEQKVLARKQAIKNECDKYSNKATKRNVKVQMQGMDFLTDIEEVWSELVEADDGTGVIRADNVDEANMCLVRMTEILKKFREHLQWEFNMQVMGATSNIQWGAVSQAELKRQQEGLSHTFTLTPEEVRKYEQDKLAFDRQLRLAGVGRGGGTPSAMAAYDNIWLDGGAPFAAGRGSGRGRGRGRGRGGRQGAQQGAREGAPAGPKVRPGLRCYKCDGPHYLRECTK